MWKTKIFCAIVMVFLFTIVFSVDAIAGEKIGILLFNKYARFIEVKKGILDQLKQDGFSESKAKYIIKNAEGCKAKTAKLVQEFATAKMDLIITVGTTATIVAAKEITDVPIVFSLVFDPIESKIAKSWKSSGNNTTGVSSHIPMSQLLDNLKKFWHVKKAAVLYTPGERHTEVMLQELQNLEAAYKIKIVPVILNKKEDIAHILSQVIRTVDAIVFTGSSVQYEAFPVIVDMTTQAKVVTATHIEELVEKGVLIGICPNPYMLGRLAGKKAVKVLKGAKPSTIPIEHLKEMDIIFNMKTAKAGKFNIPPEFMKKVKKTLE